MDILVIYNQKAGQGDQLSALKDALEAGHHKVAFKPLSKTLKRHIERAMADGCRTIVAAGGDGTVNAVVNEIMRLRHKRVNLGVLPMGTLNHFASDIGVPNDIREAALVIVQGYKKKIDIAQVGERYFLNNMSFGAYAKLVKTRERFQDKVGKGPALLWAFLKSIFKLRRYHVTINCDGKQQTYRTPFVLISNNAYDIRSWRFTNRQTLTAGELVVYILETPRLQDWLRVSWQIVQKRHLQARAFTIKKAHEVKLARTSGKNLLIAYDGEASLLDQASISVKILPQKLRVIVPKNEGHERGS